MKSEHRLRPSVFGELCDIFALVYIDLTLGGWAAAAAVFFFFFEEEELLLSRNRKKVQKDTTRYGRRDFLNPNVVRIVNDIFR